MVALAAGCQSSGATFSRPHIASTAHHRIPTKVAESRPAPRSFAAPPKATPPQIGLTAFQQNELDSAGSASEGVRRIDAEVDSRDRQFLIDQRADEKTQRPSRRHSKTDSLPDLDERETANEDTAGESGADEPAANELAPELEFESQAEEATTNPDALTLASVLRSVVQCYPEIDVAIGQLESANGKVLATWGAFDSVFTAHSISHALGFYQTYRNGVGVARPLYGGGEVYGTYRIGDGNFEPWYGERETNEAGEFKAGFSLPLLKDRNIDLRRSAVRSSELQRTQLEANVETRMLDYERFATQAYWDWVASGQAVSIQQRLLKLAQQRVEQISIRMKAGDLAAIAQIDNDRFIAKRKNSLIKAQRGLEKAAIKLSLFYRDSNCNPVVVSAGQLPITFPNADEISRNQVQSDIQAAIATRPELAELNAARAEAEVKLQYAHNLQLPKIDLKGFAGQDIGGATSSLGDKTPFELQVGVYAEVPLQRREGTGKAIAAQGKIAQIDAKRQFVTDKLRASILDAASAVNNSAKQIAQSRQAVRLTEESLRLGRLAFEEGDIDLLALNIYESSVADARLQLLEAQFKYFSGVAKYQTTVRSQAFPGS